MIWRVIIFVNVIWRVFKVSASPTGEGDDDSASSSTPFRKYSLRTRRHEQRHRTPEEIMKMLSDCDREAESDFDEADSDYQFEFDETTIEVDATIDEISEYRDLVESIQLQEKDTGDDNTPEPVFLRNLNQKGYRIEDEETYNHQQSDQSGESSNRGRTQSTPPIICTPTDTPKTGGKRKRKKNRILTHQCYSALMAEMKDKRTTKVTPTQIINGFLDEEGFTVAPRVHKAAENAVTSFRTFLRKVQISKGKLSEPSADYVIYDFTGNDTPKILRGPSKPYSNLTRPGKEYRQQLGVKMAIEALEMVSDQIDLPFEVLKKSLMEKFCTFASKTGPTATEALAHMVSLKATKRTATGISQFMKKYGIYIPGEKALRTEKRKRLPPIHFGRDITIKETGEKIPVGVFIRRKDMVQFTVKQLMEIGKIKIGDSATRVVLKMCFNQGMDGAGSHQRIFDSKTVKLSNAGHGLKSCQTFADCLLSCSNAVEKETQQGENPNADPREELYKCEDSCSYKNQKVLGLVMEKESADLQKFLMEMYPDGDVQYTFKTEKGVEIVAYCRFDMCGVDGKTRKAMSGRGGGFCYQCCMTSEEYHTPAGVRVEDSFIEYNTKEMMQEYKKFLNSEGKVDLKISSGDRKGWTQEPFGIPYGVVVTHAAINIASWVLKVAAKSNMYAANEELRGNETWEMTGELKGAEYPKEENKLLEGLKHKWRLILKDVGHGQTGGGCTGNHAKRFLLYAKDALPEFMYDSTKAGKLGKITELLYVVIRVLNSNREIDIKIYQHVCHTIGILVIHNFPWARMNETLHSVLAHSWEVIKNNNSHGLGSRSEEGIEALQKHVRSIRSGRAWLGSYSENMCQTLETLVLGGDLFLNEIVKKVPASNNKNKEKKVKPLIPENVKSSTKWGGLNFLKTVIKGITEEELNEDTASTAT